MVKRSRLYRSTLFTVTVLLTLILTGMDMPAQAAAGQAKVDRLVMGLILPFRDYFRPWINGSADHMIQLDPVMEWLIEIDPDTGKYVPWLATSWEMAPDGLSWRVELAEGVQFHHGYGEFTAKDVVHSHALWCDDNYPGRADQPSLGYRKGICLVNKVEVVNDHEVIMRCKSPCLDFEFYYSEAANVVMFSKAQWDKEGEMALETRPAGTGPYLFKERKIDQYVLYERASTPH
jgi:ABC-type transport system substrate-binding protein